MEELEDVTHSRKAVCAQDGAAVSGYPEPGPSGGRGEEEEEEEKRITGSWASSSSPTLGYVTCRGIRTCWQEQKPKKALRAREKTGGMSGGLSSSSQCNEGRSRERQSSKRDVTSTPSRKSHSTVTRGLLSTSAFAWVPLCQPSLGARTSSMDIPDEMQSCTRLYTRRNALADPMQMALPQDTRERIEKEVAERKSSFTRQVSQYFRAMYSDHYEVDLI